MKRMKQQRRQSTESMRSTRGSSRGSRSEVPDMRMARRGSRALSESSQKLAKLPRVDPKILERIEVVCGCMRETVVSDCAAAMFYNDRLVMAVLLALRVCLSELHSKDINDEANTTEAMTVFFTMSKKPLAGDALDNPYPEWLSNGIYWAVLQLSKIRRGSELGNVIDCLEEFKAVIEAPDVVSAGLPEPWAGHLNPIERWILLQALRPSLAVAVAKRLVAEVLGSNFTLTTPPIPELIRESEPTRPILFLLPNPSALAEANQAIASVLGKAMVVSINGSNDLQAANLIRTCKHHQTPVLIGSLHLSASFEANFLGTLLNKMAEEADQVIDDLDEGGQSYSGEKRSNFRVILTAIMHNAPGFGTSHISASTNPGYPVGREPTLPVGHFTRDMLGTCCKILLEPPKSTRDHFVHSVKLLNSVVPEGMSEHRLRPLIFSIAFLHSCLSQRSQGGDSGFNAPILLSRDDLVFTFHSCIEHTLGTKVEAQADAANINKRVKKVAKAVLPWSEFDRLCRAMCVGSHVGDEWDRPTLALLLSRTMQAFSVAEEGDIAVRDSSMDGAVDLGSLGSLAFEVDKRGYPVPLADVLQKVCTVWDLDDGALLAPSDSSFEILPGLALSHSISELQHNRRRREVNQFDRANMVVDEFQERLPRALEVPTTTSRSSLFLHFLVREVTGMNALLYRMQETLHHLESAIQGRAQVDYDLERVIHSLGHDHVPSEWLKAGHPSTRSLAAWFSDLVQRTEMLDNWIQRYDRSDDQGLALPPIVWMGGLASPRGFIATLTAFYAQHNHWPVHSVGIVMEVTDKSNDLREECSAIQTGAMSQFASSAHVANGVFISGLHLVKGKWDVNAGQLAPALPSDPPAEMPVVLLKVVPLDEGGKDVLQAYPPPHRVGFLACPVYRTRARSDKIPVPTALVSLSAREINCTKTNVAHRGDAEVEGFTNGSAARATASNRGNFVFIASLNTLEDQERWLHASTRIVLDPWSGI